MAGGPEPSKCCLKCASCSAGRTYSMSPARTSATNHSRSTTLRGVGIVCPTPVRCTGSYRVTMASTTSTRTCGVSPDTKNPLRFAFPRPTGASRWAPPNPGPHDGPNETGAGAEQKPPCAREQNTPAKSPDVLSTTQKYAIVASRRGGCTSV